MRHSVIFCLSVLTIRRNQALSQSQSQFARFFSSENFPWRFCRASWQHALNVKAPQQKASALVTAHQQCTVTIKDTEVLNIGLPQSDGEMLKSIIPRLSILLHLAQTKLHNICQCCINPPSHPPTPAHLICADDSRKPETQAKKTSALKWLRKQKADMRRLLNARAFVSATQLTCSSDEGQVWQRARPTLSMACRLCSASLQRSSTLHPLRSAFVSHTCVCLCAMSAMILPISFLYSTL